MDPQIFILGAAIAVAVLTAFLLYRIDGSDRWKATVTPLASIIGSGFLVAAPLLVGTFGGTAILAMGALLIVAYGFGHVMRFNIRFGEPLFNGANRDGVLTVFEDLSDAALAFAYFVSVAYYLSLLGTFVLRGFEIESEPIARGVASAVLLFIGALGFRGGIRAVTRVESIAVGLKLAIIAAICAALAAALLVEPLEAEWPRAMPFDWNAVTVLLGTLIICQGFETSRYLGEEYDAALRIRSMRLAQLIAAGIYLVFFALITPFLSTLGSGGGVTALMDVVSALAIGLLAAATIAAAASQFTASVADAVASTGLVREVSQGRLSSRNAYLILVPVALAIIWLTDVTELVSYASRAFAGYYGLQCIVAARTAMVSWDEVSHRHLRVAGYLIMAAVAGLIVILGQPAEE